MAANTASVRGERHFRAEEFVSWGYKFWFHDDNLTADIRWVNEFCRQLEERRLKIRWNCMSRVDVIYKHPELFARMAACGCSLITIGLKAAFLKC